MRAGRVAGVIGTVVIFAGLLVALVIGLRTPAAQSYVDPAGEALANLWRQSRENLGVPTTPAAGDWRLAFGAAALGYVFTTLLATPARTARGVLVTFAAWLVVGFLLYAPGLAS